jgi:transcription antitermination factor NusG
MTAAPATSTYPECPWYTLVTRYRVEKKVAACLQSKGIETFLPVISERHHWTDRHKTICTPLFAGYVFARALLSPAAKLQILTTAGVMRLVSFGTEPLPVPAKQIEDLRTLLAHKLPCALHPFLQVGRKVRIRGGSLDGIEGILAEKDKNLIISVDCIQRSVAVTIEGYELEMV